MNNEGTLVKTVKLDEKTHARLTKYGSGNIGETYQEVIIRLMDFWDKEHKGS